MRTARTGDRSSNDCNGRARDTVRAARLLLDPGIRLDLDQHRGLDQPPHLDHRGRGTDDAEELAVRLADLLPIVDVRDVDARTHHVTDTGAGLLQSGVDVVERLDGLCVRVARTDDRTARVGRRGAGD